jgi:prepilin-type N-terminal cleavage/methylation domain-containing protein
MSQRGVSFLEIIVVMAVLGIAMAMAVPNINQWKTNTAIDGDFNALLSQIEYLKLRTRAINGTALLTCSSTSSMSFQLSSAAQSSTSVVGSGFTSALLEDPSSLNPAFNILSGKSNINSLLCSGRRGIFVSSGMSGIEGGGSIQIEINYNNDYVNYKAYQITVYPTTSFVVKKKMVAGSWVEVD